MNLYSLTLQQPTCITKAIIGNFSGNMKQQEIVVARGKVLEIMKIDENGKLQSLYSQEIFGIIQNISPFKLTEGIKHDFILVLSDSGRIIILQYNPQTISFDKVHQETYGKSGLRRIVPGQFIATDPCGRACMIGAIEKQKFVYILNSENSKLTISSPLEAHKSHTITFDIVGIDTNYQNSQFACIEADYGEPSNEDSSVVTGQIKKNLTIYQLELGLNHVIKLSSDPIHESAHMLISVPAREGPGGLLVFCEDFLSYRNIKNEETKLCPYPRRVGGPTDRKMMITSYSFHRQKDFFFYLIQTEIGDLFKVTLHFTNKEVHSITIQYFDSVPVSTSLCIMKKGYLFVPCEKGNHLLFKFTSIGQDEKDPVITDSTMAYDDFKLFLPRRLRNLELTDELNNLSVITDIKVDDLQGLGQAQIYATCAAGTRSSLRIMKHGLAIQEIAESSLPGTPSGIFTIRNHIDGSTKYILISFFNQTLVLSIRDSQIVEIKDSGIELNQQTIYVNVLEDGSIIQILQNGIRHIKKDNRINQFLTESKIVKATSNQCQLALGLQGGEIIYFELDSLSQLYEVSKTSIDSEIMCLDIGDIPEGRQKCKFLGVGLGNNTVRILSLDQDSCLQKIAIQGLPSAVAESIALVEMNQYDSHFEAESQLYLYVGMNNGILLRASIDNITGGLSDIRTKFLGSKPVKCFKYIANSTPAVMALSSKPWMCFNYNNKYFQVPLSYSMLDYSAIFSTSDCPEGIVCTVQNTLKIIAVEKYGEYLNQKQIPLRLSPRKLIVNPEFKNLIIMECDHRVYGTKEKAQIKEQLYSKFGESGQIAKKVPESQIGTMLAPVGSWASQLRIYDPNLLQTTDLVTLEQNEAAVSCVLMQFKEISDTFLIVGTVKDLKTYPKKSFSQCYLLTYIISEEGDKLQFQHRTEIEDHPYCLTAWRGKLLTGTGNTLRYYEMGKKQLLKKAELRDLQQPITHLQVTGDRIFAAHQSESVHVYRYRNKEQTFYEIADDILPRWVSNMQLLDYHTVLIADKFENISVCRIPALDNQEVEDNPLFYKKRFDSGYLNGAPFKMESICNYFVGEVVTSLQKAPLISTGKEVAIYATTMGSIGAFYPFETKEDIDFFVHLEMYMRIEQQPLCGRDHSAFRSYFQPCKNVIDGDLCEQFNLLSTNKQRLLAEELERTGADVQKQLDELRNKIL